MRRPVRTLTGRLVVITGAGRGIGAAIAHALADEGASLALGDIDRDRVVAVATEIGGETFADRLDVTDGAAFGGFLDEVEDAIGPIDVLINNAGVMPVSAFVDEPDEATAHQLETNLHAVIVGSRQAARRMLPRGRGHIVNIASAAGKGGFPGIVTYSATKFGVVGLSAALHAELHGTGVDVSCVLPAVVRTDLAAGVRSHWLVPTSAPGDVADAVVDVLRRPRPEVYVPGRLNALYRAMALVPARGQDWLLRAAGGARLFPDAAHSPERAEYERRVSGGWEDD